MDESPNKGIAFHGSDVPGILSVTATYVYFLLFAQFAFLKLLQNAFDDAGPLRIAMGAMGIAGIVASLITASRLQRVGPFRMLRCGFAMCAAGALIALCPMPGWALMMVAAWIGAGAGVVTVSLASGLREMLNGRWFATRIGVGTGFAYAICNIPWLFELAPRGQTIFAVMACALGFLMTRGCTDRARGSRVESPSALSARAYTSIGFVGIVLAFLALVWLDSAAFAIIQDTLTLKGVTWGNPTEKMIQGGVHLLAAIAAGVLIDAGFFIALLAGAYALFAGSFTLLSSVHVSPWYAGPSYAIGISLYSVALVVFPSLWPDAPGRVPVPWRAGILFGIAGWLGSALGVGMAQDLHTIPRLFLFISGGLLFLAWMATSPRNVFRLGPAEAISAMGGALALMVFLWPSHPVPRGNVESADLTLAVERGRQVYIEEGCINCHSQYIRPRTRDVEFWGPYRPVDFDETPPMIGNRRQGPDLMNVGNRRNTQWQKLHLKNPPWVSPGSKMPSYQHLFVNGRLRGDDLVVYLDSLGPTTLSERIRLIQSWRLSGERGRADRGRALFRQLCTPCHGLNGNGDGPLSAELARPAQNLRKGDFWHVPDDLTGEDEWQALAGIVKFGVLGTPMAGHEYLEDVDIADIVAYVRTLNDTNNSSQVASMPAAENQKRKP